MGVEKGHNTVWPFEILIWNEIESGNIQQTFSWGLNLLLFKALTLKMKYL